MVPVSNRHDPVTVPVGNRHHERAAYLFPESSNQLGFVSGFVTLARLP